MPGKTTPLTARLASLTENIRFLYIIIGIVSIVLAVQVFQNQLLLQNRYSISPARLPLLIGQEIVFPTLPSVAGSAWSISEFSSTYYLLIFFHPNCSYSELDLPLWQTIYQQASNYDVDLIAVTSETDVNLLAAYTQKHEIIFPVLIDREQELFNQLRIMGTPTKVLLSNDWRVLQVWYGWTTQRSHQSDLGGMFAFLGIDPRSLPQSEGGSFASPLESTNQSN
jgi:peroxiredoxin